MKKEKSFFRGVIKLIAIILIIFIIFLVGVVVFVADSPEEFFTFRKDNIIEYFLNREDGISHVDMVKCVYAAYATTIDASALYPDDPMLEDAYKHYTWNYESTKLIGEEKTKLITDNHEVALTIRERVKEYYHCFLNNYRAEDGVLKYFAFPRACVSTIKLIPEIRRETVNESKKVSALEIENYYSKATIMDFYNNEMGRQDALSDLNSLNRTDAFNNAMKEDRIIKTYSTIEPQFYDYTLHYVTATIDY